MLHSTSSPIHGVKGLDRIIEGHLRTRQGFRSVFGEISVVLKHVILGVMAYRLWIR